MFVDPASGKIAATVPTGQGPHEVEVSSDGRLAFVSNYGDRTSGGNTLSVIDIAARKELKRGRSRRARAGRTASPSRAASSTSRRKRARTSGATTR